MSIASEIKFQKKSNSFKNEQNIIKKIAQPLDWTIFYNTRRLFLLDNESEKILKALFENNDEARCFS